MQTELLGIKPEQKNPTILVVDNDPAIGAFLSIALRIEASAHVLLASDGAQALALSQTVAPDLFILDYQLPGMTGLELADRLSTFPQSD